MRLPLPYGEKELSVDVPEKNLLDVLKPKELKIEKNADDIIRDALQNPIKTRRLRDIAKKGDSVAIAVDDHTRPCPTDQILPPLLEELYLAGVRDGDITIIFATGSHRTVTDEEASRLLGRDIASRIRYVSNDCWGDDFVYIGDTSMGTPVHLKRAFYEADVRVLTGDVEIHYFAGYGGGRKSVLPGVAGHESIQDNYQRNFFHPNSRPGKLDGNPMYENMSEAAKMAGVDYTINIVQTEEGIIGSFAGYFDSVLRKGAKLVDDAYRVTSGEEADIVVTAANGSPHDLDLYQAYKALHLGLNVVKEGGVIILVAECREGVGDGVGASNYEKWMKKYKTKEEIQRELGKKFNIGGHKAFYQLKAMEKANIILVTDMPEREVVGTYRLGYAGTPDEALQKAFEKMGDGVRVTVIPEGLTTLSSVKK
ncbi:MAG: nickel-dependent lactate racemase [Candidatus Altiarchaeota archaeon]|nr:nickel-dependent lactate racemase [Candidatus Altiarchaeota archaeon]